MRDIAATIFIVSAAVTMLALACCAVVATYQIIKVR